MKKEKQKILTIEVLVQLKPHSEIAKGEIEDSADGINMTGSGNPLKWVAVTGEIGDWCIYVQWAHRDYEWIKHHGDKVHNEHNIRKLVPCSDKAYARYRQ